MIWALEDWLHVRGEHDGPLINRILKSGCRLEDGLSVQAIHDIVRRRWEQAGIAKFTPHDLRRTFAGDLMDLGADLSVVQALMGHANANTTVSYDRRGQRARRRAMQLRRVGYERRFGT